MDLTDLKVPPQSDDRTRLRRAQLARLTFGVSPAALMLAYADWLAHFLISPDKHEAVARKAGEHAGRYVDPDTFVASSRQHEGSWWPAGQRWLAEHSGEPVAPPAMGAPEKGYRPLDPAPGTYVLER